MSCSQAAARVSPADQIASAIIERLEAGVRPWVKPWNGRPRMLPLRACGTPYAGINLFWLWLVADTRGYASSHWMTYAQAARLGGQVRRGERSTVVLFYKRLPGRDADRRAPNDRSDAAGEASPARCVLKSYPVFNLDQIDGLDAIFAPAGSEAGPLTGREAALDAFFDALPGRVIIGGERAGYDPEADLIRMPAPASFVTAEHFYATLAHERAHWTGHPSRLGRTFGERFGDAAYALEELCAELASAILGAELGLPVEHLDDHAAYIGSWLGALRAQPRLVLSVAAKAQAAADYLLAALSPIDPSGPVSSQR